jgi:hypothetical protein
MRSLESKSLRERLFENRPDELGDAWDAVGQIGAAAAQTGLNQLFGSGGSASGVARGLAAISAFGSQVLQALAQILSAARSGQVPIAQALSDAQTTAGYLENPQYVYQAQRGNDAAALREFKSQAAAIVQQLRSLGPGPASTTPQMPAGPSANAPQVGFSVSPLILIGGGIGLFLLLKK